MTDNDKKKQIEEMAEFIHVDSSFPGFEEDARQLAEELYRAGYRKQVKGEWIQRMRPYEDEIECSVCNERFNILDNCTEKFDFCPNCGAKMKGGESDVLD